MDSADRGHVVERACACMHAYVRGIDADVAGRQRLKGSKIQENSIRLGASASELSIYINMSDRLGSAWTVRIIK